MIETGLADSRKQQISQRTRCNYSTDFDYGFCTSKKGVDMFAHSNKTYKLMKTFRLVPAL